MSDDPVPKVGELWLIKEDIGLPYERRLILVCCVYATSTGSGSHDIAYVAVDGIMDGVILERLGTGWFQERISPKCRS